ncbi:hypothetical protein ACFFX1_54700 [Dactylosporangium sucinum]|uniref:Uncharacterized protein n=1 Tax=Dactylosporangium sucinum TaxID=1424081 RepID=A0A917U2N1_9ACTN|nr:hypothetical protein [Dactylosporangium sucinum]GGM53748.1 hypothetical protein GCM10007977_064180 [Dactylosporangium sucinum]
MISRHTDKTESTRVPPEVSDAARAELETRGWTVFEFLAACLTALTRQPSELMAVVERHKPEPKPKGRPRKTAREMFDTAEGRQQGPAAKAMRARRKPPAE